MKQNNLWLISLLILVPLVAFPQKKTTKKQPAQKTKTEKPAPQKPDVVADEKKVRDIIAFLEFMLNTLGNSSTPVRDKEVLITESYSKIFRDSKVQVEDDLDEERKVITNKDVVAYLKDVNFFFANVRFEFTIDNIKSSTLPNGEYFYKVSTRRNLSGTTSDRKPINNTKPRYIEINYNPKDQDLKIVSIYTNEFNEKVALTNWWKGLSYEWQSIFKKKLSLVDSASLTDIKRITSIDELNVSGNRYIRSLEPLSQLNNLRSINLSNTEVTDLSPIRNLTELTSLNVSNTNVRDLSPLKYSNKLENLNISQTEVNDISVIEKMNELKILNAAGLPISDFNSLASLTALQKLSLASTKISDLAPLENQTELTDLDLSNTQVQALDPIKSLANLITLDIDSTKVRNIQALSSMEELKLLHANSSGISDLTPLQKLPKLEKIYCDKSPIKREAAIAFMALNPKVLVIFDSEDLKEWWNTITPEWQKILSKTAKIGLTPSKEELAKIPLLDSINISDSRIETLEPLTKLQKLKAVVARKSKITDLSPLIGHKEISFLNISETSIRDISILPKFTKLKVLLADNSKIENIESLGIPGLEKLYADNTALNDLTAREFLSKNSGCLLIYKTDKLKEWWLNLPESWKDIFKTQLKVSDKITREQLHQIVELKSLQFKDAPITDLKPLNEFVKLEELHFSGTPLISIAPLDNLKFLKSLHATNSPIQTIETLSVLSELEELDISNTPIEDVYELWRLKKLKKLNCAGTQIKRLDALEKMENLEYLDCSNTNVTRLSPLDYLPLKALKCYNTKVSAKGIENFKASHPECQVIYYR
ncbi:MAG TPA: leucine-rich repeat domain-containing protein [Cyclobacteriaceae bacterium]|nr:leucine-rich repeat domain-containing protein [Cyclobacteriaceae bacterium]